jgi:hypothetical protein
MKVKTPSVIMQKDKAAAAKATGTAPMGKKMPPWLMGKGKGMPAPK